MHSAHEVMNHIEQKYRQTRLTKEELQHLRAHVNDASDETIAAGMQAHWQEDIDVSGVPEEAIAVIRQRLDAQIGSPSGLRHRAWTLIQRVAVVLLPICLGALGYVIYQQQTPSDGLLTILTHQGEQVSVVFPDSTQARMNQRSVLSYRAQAFVKQREIAFQGEGFFDVRHDSTHPFVIHTSGMRVKVVGTKFNLSSYPDSPTATLCLFEGSVWLHSDKTKEEIHLKPNQKCTLDKATGRIKVVPFSEDAAYYTAWQRHEIVFRSTPLTQVVEEIGRVYGENIRLLNINGADRFTGTLPSSNLNQCLVILSKLYDCKVRRTDRAIVLAKEANGKPSQ